MEDKTIVYAIDGVATDHEWILVNRKLIEAGMYDYVRTQGYLPILDVPPSLSYQFDEDKEKFNYHMEMMVYPAEPEQVHNYFGILITDGVAVSKDFRYVTLCEAL